MRLDNVIDNVVRETEYFKLHGANVLYDPRKAEIRQREASQREHQSSTLLNQAKEDFGNMEDAHMKILNASPKKVVVSPETAKYIVG